MNKEEIKMPKVIYACEICGKQFMKKEAAESCEKFHTTVKQIKGYEFDCVDKAKYPKSIKCEMNDGKVITFYRHPFGK